MEKKEIRSLIFGKRRDLSDAYVAEESHKICNKIIKSDLFIKAKTLYAYMDCKGEASPKILMEAAWKMGKKVAVPRVEGADLCFYYINSYQDTMPGYFGIPEPVTADTAVDEEALLIIPGVAFDRQLHRCGYGKGFYDRYLQLHSKHETIAIAFDFQILEEVPSEEHDMLPQRLVTPGCCYTQNEKKITKI